MTDGEATNKVRDWLAIKGSIAHKENPPYEAIERLLRIAKAAK